MKQVLFVCLGNICRSPLAEGLFAVHAERMGLSGAISAGSAGISSWHVGDPPSALSQKAAAKLGLSIADQCCRQVSLLDFQVSDFVLGMDQENVRTLQMLAGSAPCKAEIALFLDFAGKGKNDIPDPWGLPEYEYDSVAAQIDYAMPAIINRIRDQL